MPTAPADSWDCLREGGRAFVRVPLPESKPHPAGAAALVAQPLAGRFRVEDLFSAGPLGFLLAARDRTTGQAVLIKAVHTAAVPLPPDIPDRAAALGAEGRRLRHELQTERRLLVRLRNAGCAAVPHPVDFVYDLNPALVALGVEPAFAAVEPYLILPRLAGTSLEEVLERDFPQGMPERLALETLRPVVAALAVLHEPWQTPSGHTWYCIYEDLKPANILIDRAGRPTLLDFGGCQVVVDGTPVLPGGCTPGYAPPECLGPTRVLLPCADVYTIGGTLYQMLTGVDPRARLARAAPGAQFDPRALPTGLSPGIRALVARCLAVRPSDRPANADRVGLLIDELLS